MQKGIAKLLRVLKVAVPAGILAAAALFAYGWYRDVEPTLVSAGLTPQQAKLGELVTFEVVLNLGWHQNPRPILAELQEGVDVIAGDTFQRIGWGLGTWRCQGRLTMRGYRPGEYGDVPASLRISGTGVGQTDRLELHVPAFTVEPLEVGESTDLNRAGTLSEDYLASQQPRPWWIWLLVVLGALVLMIVSIIVIVRLSRDVAAAAKRIPPWMLALDALDNLAKRMPMEADACFQELTDILRGYIEAVYKLPATEQTTAEFLRTLHGRGSRLTDEQRAMLTEFLSAADMIKFARGQADLEQMQEASKKARQFVVETSAEIRQREAEGMSHA